MPLIELKDKNYYQRQFMKAHNCIQSQTILIKLIDKSHSKNQVEKNIDNILQKFKHAHYLTDFQRSKGSNKEVLTISKDEELMEKLKDKCDLDH